MKSQWESYTLRNWVSRLFWLFAVLRRYCQRACSRLRYSLRRASTCMAWVCRCCCALTCNNNNNNNNELIAAAAMLLLLRAMLMMFCALTKFQKNSQIPCGFSWRNLCSSFPSLFYTHAHTVWRFVKTTGNNKARRMKLSTTAALPDAVKITERKKN